MTLPGGSNSPRLGRWIVVTGPNVICVGCKWWINGGQDDRDNPRRLLAAARRHAGETGHEIQVHRGQVGWIR